MAEYKSTDISVEQFFDYLDRIMKYSPTSYAFNKVDYMSIPTLYNDGNPPPTGTNILNLLPDGNYQIYNIPVVQVPLELNGYEYINLQKTTNADSLVQFTVSYGKYTFVASGEIPDPVVWTNYTLDQNGNFGSTIYFGESPTPIVEDMLWVDIVDDVPNIFAAVDGNWLGVNYEGLLNTAIYDKFNVKKPIIDAIQERLAKFIQDYELFIRHKNNELVLTHISLAQKAKLLTIFSREEVDALFAINSSIYTNAMNIIVSNAVNYTTSTFLQNKYNTEIKAIYDAHILTHITVEDTTNWDSKAASDHTHTSDQISITGDKVKGDVPDSALSSQYGIKEIGIIVANLEELASLSEEQINTIYTNGRMIITDFDPNTNSGVFYKILDNTYMGTLEYLKGILRLYSDAVVVFANIKDKPDTILGYGIIDMAGGQDDLDRFEVMKGVITPQDYGIIMNDIPYTSDTQYTIAIQQGNIKLDDSTLDQDFTPVYNIDRTLVMYITRSRENGTDISLLQPTEITKVEFSYELEQTFTDDSYRRYELEKMINEEIAPTTGTYDTVFFSNYNNTYYRVTNEDISYSNDGLVFMSLIGTGMCVSAALHDTENGSFLCVIEFSADGPVLFVIDHTLNYVVKPLDIYTENPVVFVYDSNMNPMVGYSETDNEFRAYDIIQQPSLAIGDIKYDIGSLSLSNLQILNAVSEKFYIDDSFVSVIYNTDTTYDGRIILETPIVGYISKNNNGDDTESILPLTIPSESIGMLLDLVPDESYTLSVHRVYINQESASDNTCGISIIGCVYQYEEELVCFEAQFNFIGDSNELILGNLYGLPAKYRKKHIVFDKTISDTYGIIDNLYNMIFYKNGRTISTKLMSLSSDMTTSFYNFGDDPKYKWSIANNKIYFKKDNSTSIVNYISSYPAFTPPGIVVTKFTGIFDSAFGSAATMEKYNVKEVRKNLSATSSILTDREADFKYDATFNLDGNAFVKGNSDFKVYIENPNSNYILIKYNSQYQASQFFSENLQSQYVYADRAITLAPFMGFEVTEAESFPDNIGEITFENMWINIAPTLSSSQGEYDSFTQFNDKMYCVIHNTNNSICEIGEDDVTTIKKVFPDRAAYYSVITRIGNNLLTITKDGDILILNTDFTVLKELSGLTNVITSLANINNSIVIGAAFDNSNTVLYYSSASPDEYKIVELPSVTTSIHNAFVTASDTTFMVVKYSSQYASISNDGLNWTSYKINEATTRNNYTSVCYGNGKFVVSSNNNHIDYSTDGKVWTRVIIESTNRAWISVKYGNGMFVMVDRDSGKIAFSYDGIIWIIEDIGYTPSGGSSPYWGSGMGYRDGRFYIGSNNFAAPYNDLIMLNTIPLAP